MLNIPQLALAKLPQLGEHQTGMAAVPGFFMFFFAFPCKPSMSILPTLFNYKKNKNWTTFVEASAQGLGPRTKPKKKIVGKVFVTIF